MISIWSAIGITVGFALWSVFCIIVGFSLAQQAKPKQQPNPRLN